MVAISGCPTRPGSLAARHRPAAGVVALLYDLTLVAAGSLLVAISAQVAVRLPFAPVVPVTGQTFAVLLVGALLGPGRGGAALALYLAEGGLGLPVFAELGAGPAHLLGPTGGYLLGFVPAAVLVGALAERGWDRSVGRTLLALTSGTTVIFILGLVWLSVTIFALAPGPDPASTWGTALRLGLWPFLPGAAVKIILAAALLPAGWRLLGRIEGS